MEIYDPVEHVAAEYDLTLKEYLALHKNGLFMEYLSICPDRKDSIDDSKKKDIRDLLRRALKKP